MEQNLQNQNREVCSIVLSQDAKKLNVHVYKPKSYKQAKDQNNDVESEMKKILNNDQSSIRYN